MEFNFNSYDNSKQSILYCEVDKCKVVIDLKEQLEQLKFDYSELEKRHNNSFEQLEEIKERFLYFHHTDVEFEQSRNAFINEIKKNNKLKNIIEEIKNIAEENIYYLDCDYRWILEQILQKIQLTEKNNNK